MKLIIEITFQYSTPDANCGADAEILLDKRGDTNPLYATGFKLVY